MEDNTQEKRVISDYRQKAIEWLRQFKRTQDLQLLVEQHEFSDDELAGLLGKLHLTPKKKQERNVVNRWA